MSYTTTSPGLCLPMQARPLDRTGMRTAALGGAGVEADFDLFGWLEQAATDVIDYVTHHPVETVTNPWGTVWHLATGY